MRKSLLLWVLIFSLLSTFVIGCGGDDDDDDDDTTGPVLTGLADFADTWYALAEKSSVTPIWGYPEVDYRTLDIFLDSATGDYRYISTRSTTDMGVATWETRSNVNYLILTSNVDQSITEIIVNDFDDNFAELAYPGTTTNAERMFVRTPGIYGVVNYDATNMPATNVTVSLTFQGTPVATATTNAWGVYAFNTSLTDGNTYYVTANVDGYIEASMGVEFEETMPAFGHLSLVQEGGSTTGTITGNITDSATGSAINGVNVVLDGATSLTGNGFYSFTDVAYGTHSIVATVDGYETYTNTVVLDGASVTHNISMTPESSSATLETISMAWQDGSTADFDLHVLTPDLNGTTYDIYYATDHDGSLTELPYLEHQGDAVSGTLSPEEVIFSHVYSGTYTVFAKRYGSSNDFRSDNLYVIFNDTDDNTVESVYASDASGSGSYWIIATITNGVVTEVNELTNTNPVGGGSSNPELDDVQLLWPSTYDIDLDLHILTPLIGETAYHVYYNDEGNFYTPPYMELQGDDQGENGLEEVLVNRWEDGSYTIFVKNNSFTNFDETGALVKIFDENGDAEYIYASSASGSATWDFWHVADVNGTTNEITVVNAFELTQPTTQKGFQGVLEVSSK